MPKPQDVRPSYSSRAFGMIFFNLRRGNRYRAVSSRIFMSLLAASLLAACGKVGAPAPPARITERATDLSAIQRGSKIVLSWPSPSLSAKESAASYIEIAEVYRLREQRDEDPVLDPDDYEELAQVVGFLDRATIEAQVKNLGHLEYIDSVNLGDPRALANTRLRYAVRYLNKREQGAAFSNTVSIEPSPGISMPPTGLGVTLPGQDQVVLTWSPPDANVDGSQPATIVGYNVYRRNAKRATGGTTLNSEPVTDITFTDTKFQYQADYVYFVRALSQGANGLIESADSASVAVTPADTFPPSAPEPVTIASANGTISLFWPSAPERDVVGYNVYRASSASAPDSEWTKLTAQPITPVTFRDDTVTIDQVYYYRVTAVDRFNNESRPSPAVSETAHP